MTGLDNLLLHPAQPVRAIYLHCVPGEGDLWQAEYRGDKWTPAFRTAKGKRWLVRDALLSGDVRRGLPIIDDAGLHTPAQSRPQPRSGQWPGGHAA